MEDIITSEMMMTSPYLPFKINYNIRTTQLKNENIQTEYYGYHDNIQWSSKGFKKKLLSIQDLYQFKTVI